MGRAMREVVLLVPGLEYGGGVPTMAVFLHRTLQDSGRYEPRLVSTALAANDAASVRLLAPRTWWQGVCTGPGEWRGLPFTKVGAFLAEFEFQRYRPRKALNRLLEHTDLVQVVAGTPSMARAVASAQKPTCLYVATTVRRERAVVLAHWKGFRRVWSWLMTEINARCEARALEGVDHVFALSEYTRAQLAHAVPRAKLSLGVPGVDTSLFHPPERYGSDGPILAVGRFADPRKHAGMLLEAYRRLRERCPDAPGLLLVGEYPRAADWMKATEWGIADQIEVRLNATPEQLAPLYRQASLFVLSSAEEGLGIVLLEAMASGLPVVSTRCGGPETCVIEGETGYLAPVGDADALAGGMQAILENPALRVRMGKTARRIAEEQFSFPTAGKHFIRVYDELLG